jgi:hypothetical protein
MVLDLDKLRLAKDDSLDRVGRVASGIFDILDLGHDPIDVAGRHRLVHERGHDTETTNAGNLVSINQ